MTTPYLGEIRIFSFDFAPRGWAYCAGQILSIAQNQALFSLLGTIYGGNGVTTFALPDLRSRVPIHASSSHALGESAGAESHTLTLNQIPQHNHAMAASTSATTGSPGGAIPGTPTAAKPYRNGSVGAQLAPSLANSGNNQPHPNIQPYLTVNFSIALQGIYPSRN
jgi:microcystin-dependent protein